jgi:hypothetical protein
LNAPKFEDIVAKYSSLQTVLPDLMSPRCTTRSTFGSAFTSSTSAGKCASCSGPYGVSPITATVSALAESLTGVPFPATAAPEAASTSAAAEAIRSRRISHPSSGGVAATLRADVASVGGGPVNERHRRGKRHCLFTARSLRRIPRGRLAS